MLTCSKFYTDIPLAHRQFKHDGRCRSVHGHNWSICITFIARSLDDNGFVVDFGKLHYIRDWIDSHLDHACLWGDDDMEMEQLKKTCLFKFYHLPNASCEGLAEHLYKVFSQLVTVHENGRVSIKSVEVYEDSNNVVSYSKE